jgi:hypothetical protein
MGCVGGTVWREAGVGRRPLTLSLSPEAWERGPELEFLLPEAWEREPELETLRSGGVARSGDHAKTRGCEQSTVDTKVEH